MRKVLRWLLAIVLGAILCLVLFLGIVTAFAIPIELTRFKAPLEDMAAKLLGRPVKIEGSVVVATSLNPTFTLKGLRIQNPPKFAQPDFLLMKEVRLQVSVLPLFGKKIHIPEFKVHGLAVTLEENEQGDVNWIFSPEKRVDTLENTNPPADISKPTVAERETNTDIAEKGKAAVNLANDTFVVGKLDFQKIEVSFYGNDKEQPSRFILSSCEGAMAVGQPMRLDIEGKAGEHPYTVDVSLASLEEFISDNKTWVDINLEIAKTSFDLSGNLDLATAAQSLTLSASVGGSNLSTLGDLFFLDLPPFAPYVVTTQLHLTENVAELQELKVKTGVSSLTGYARIEREEANITANIDLHSPLIQVDDFVFDEWSWQDEEVQGEKEELNEDADSEVVATTDEKPVQGENKKLIDPQVLKRFDCTLHVVADKVESGKDFLGSGEMKASLKDGRISVDPLSITLPGGAIEFSASLKPGDEKSEGSIKVLIENFDIGILVRRSQPDSDMGGNVNLNMDLSSTAGSISELMGAGNGYFDFSGDLTNFKSGIIDLWAVNLVSAILSTGEENQSNINCAVGRWSAESGVLTSEAFFVDTSKIRICAEGEVNLKEENINIKVAPQAKRAEFFSLATPVKLKGSFSDLNVKVGKGAIFGTAVKIIISPVTTPLKRMFNNKIPRDGSDVCGMELGPENREEIIVPGCR
ncbi:AsmA family protein [Desulforhopalus sp. 52FAK]